jgi:NADPH:quinone reductase-like Zn-dependent oxidoreductase
MADAAPADEALVRELGATHVVPRGDGFASAVRALYPSGVDALIDAALVGPPALAAVRAVESTDHRRNKRCRSAERTALLANHTDR